MPDGPSRASIESIDDTTALCEDAKRLIKTRLNGFCESEIIYLARLLAPLSCWLLAAGARLDATRSTPPALGSPPLVTIWMGNADKYI